MNSHIDRIAGLPVSDQETIAKSASIILTNHYNPPTLESALSQAYNNWYSNKTSSDWAKIPPTYVDFRTLFKRYPQHRFCNLVIARSEKNPTFIGLYCDKHNKLLQWVNSYQIYDLMKPGTSLKIRNISGDNGTYPL